MGCLAAPSCQGYGEPDATFWPPPRIAAKRLEALLQNHLGSNASPAVSSAQLGRRLPVHKPASAVMNPWGTVEAHQAEQHGHVQPESLGCLQNWPTCPWQIAVSSRTKGGWRAVHLCTAQWQRQLHSAQRLRHGPH